MNMLISGVTLVLACAAFWVYEMNAVRQSMVRQLSMQAQITGASSASALLFDDAKAAQETLSVLRTEPAILFGGIYRWSGEALAVYGAGSRVMKNQQTALAPGQLEAHWFGPGELSLVRLIVFQGKVVGSVYLLSDLRELDKRLERYGWIVAAVLLLSLIAAFLLSRPLQAGVIGPMLDLAAAAKVVTEKKDYSVRATETATTEELRVLIGSFNEMLEQIQHRDHALRTSQEQLEQRVMQRTAELDEMNRELEGFTYSVAHDMRAPLRHIQGFSNLLVEALGENLPEDAGRHLTHITGATQHMGQLIDDLLGLARIGRQEPKFEMTGLGTIVQEVISSLQPECEGREIEWEIGDLPFVECDAGLLRQVFYNLIANAVKYSRPRRPAVIAVGQTDVGGKPVIYVRDNGVGFNMKYANKLFGVFQRLHRKEDFEGTGVGLATVQRILQKHGGEIWAEAELDKGATFYFRLGTKLTEETGGYATAPGKEKQDA
jgi:signal transduction histidine kinase